jgi:hypothetical protein
LAISKRPLFRATAPVKDPSQGRKSSLSRRLSASEAQCTFTRGFTRLGERRVDGVGHELLADAGLAGYED